MKGGGLTWAGWLAVGIGSMLVYAGMTGQSLVSELAGVLTGNGLVKGGPIADPATFTQPAGMAYPLVTPRPVASVPPAPPFVQPKGLKYPLVSP